MADASSSKPNSPLSPSDEEKARKQDEIEAMWQRRRRGGEVVIEGYVNGGDGDGGGSGQTKCLTNDDLEELKACVDLGFRFKYESIPELVPTLPALDLCYSLNQQYLNEQKGSVQPAQQPETAAPPITDWKIAGPGEDPEKVKERLKYWAQAVACTVKLCD